METSSHFLQMSALLARCEYFAPFIELPIYIITKKIHCIPFLISVLNNIISFPRTCLYKFLKQKVNKYKNRGKHGQQTTTLFISNASPPTS